MSLKKIRTKHKPSPEAKVINLLQKCLPKKLLQKHFSLREYSLNIIKNLWWLSSYSKPLLKQGFEINTIRLANCNCEWIFKNESDKKLTVFYVHGGAYLGGSLSSARQNSMRYPLNVNASLFIVDYRISAAGKYPCALDDALSAYKFMLSGLPADSEIIIIGDSAGGGLALSLVKKLLELNIKQPKKIILNSPWVDLTCSSSSYIANAKNDSVLCERFLKECARYYAGESKMLKNKYVSPLFCDFTGFPPIHIHVGTNEILLCDSINIADKASSQGVTVRLKIWNGMFHMFHYQEKIIRESAMVCKDIYKDIAL